MAIAALIRIPTLGRAYWVDEGISIGIAHHPLSRIPTVLRLDGSPPLYYLVLHLWMNLVGSGEVATHLLSLVMSLALVPLAYWAARRLFGTTAAWCAAALFATNPFLAWYSTETRMYVLVCGLALLAVTFALEADATRSRRYATLSATFFALLLYTHNWGIFLLVATTTVLGAKAFVRRDRRQMVAIATYAGATLVAYLPWLPILVDQVRETGAPWAVSPTLRDLIADVSASLSGGLAPFLIPCLLAVIGLVAVANIRNADGPRARPPASFAKLLTWVAILTTLMGWLASQSKPSWALRYLAVVVPMFLLAIVGSLVLTRVGRRAIVTGCVVLGSWGLFAVLRPANSPQLGGLGLFALIRPVDKRYVKSNAAAVAAAAAPTLSPGDLVVVTQTEQVPVLAHYFPPGLRYATPTGPVTDTSVVNWRHLVDRLEVSDPCVTIKPLIAELPVGVHVLLVNPLHAIGSQGSTWYRVVNGQVAVVTEFLENDPSLRSMGVVAPGTNQRPYGGVIGELFTKESNFTGCATGT
jgi:hypothetical protein